MGEGSGRENVEEVACGCQGVRPIKEGNGCVEKKSAHHIGNGSDDSFGFAILLRGVGAGQAIGDPISIKESVEIFVVKFAAIVALETLDRGVKLCFDVSVEFGKDREHLRFKVQRKNP